MQPSRSNRKRVTIRSGKLRGDVRQVPGRLGTEEGFLGDETFDGHKRKDEKRE